MNSKVAVKRISGILGTIPYAHDGMGRTASCAGALKYQADMRVIAAMLYDLACDCDELKPSQIDSRLTEIETKAAALKKAALSD